MSGFATQYGNDNLRVFGNKKAGCSRVDGAFQYEHNQRSASEFSFSVGFGALSINYSSGGVQSGQNGTPIFFEQ